MEEFAEVKISGKSYELPVITGTEDEKGIDITKLRALSGAITLDSGFKNTGATKSAVTYLDGEEGILQYRGYSIEELAEKASFMEVSYLLINGELPTTAQLSEFEGEITNHTLIHEDMKRFFEAYPSKAHPMGIVASLLCSLSTFYPDSQNPNRTEEEIELTIFRLLAKLPTIAAWAYKNFVGHPVVYPKNELSYGDNFLNMMFSLPSEDYKIDPVVSDALNKLLILHADHEQNCSASTVRLVGSSHAYLFRFLPELMHYGVLFMVVLTKL